MQNGHDDIHHTNPYYIEFKQKTQGVDDQQILVSILSTLRVTMNDQRSNNQCLKRILGNWDAAKDVMHQRIQKRQAEIDERQRVNILAFLRKDQYQFVNTYPPGFVDQTMKAHQDAQHQYDQLDAILTIATETLAYQNSPESTKQTFSVMQAMCNIMFADIQRIKTHLFAYFFLEQIPGFMMSSTAKSPVKVSQQTVDLDEYKRDAKQANTRTTPHYK